MKLNEKGDIQAPPTMKAPFEKVSQTIQQWKGIIAAAHWDLYNPKEVDGVDFYFGEEELGHIHLNGDVHLATDMALRNQLIDRGMALEFPFAGEYERWCMYEITDEESAKHAIELFRLNYERITKRNSI